jgi:hypothetical protein
MTSYSGNGPEGNSFSTVDFLRWLRADGPWLLVAIHPDSGAIEAVTVTTLEAAGEWVRERNGRLNLYYSPNPTFRAMNKKPTKRDIAAIEFVYGDLDPKADETPEAAKTRYMTALAAFRPVRSATIDSGNGMQGLWRLASRIPLSGTDASERIKDAEARCKALLGALGGTPGTQNVDRILRLPGTTNLPNGVKRAAGRVACEARVVEMNGAVCTLAELPTPEVRGPGRPRAAGNGASGRELPPALRHMLYLTGEAPAGYASRSELFWAFINTALRQGVDENRIVEECLNETYAAGSIYQHVQDKGREREGGGEAYVKTQIEKALNEPEGVTGDQRAIIRMRDGKLDETYRAIEKALVAAKCPVYVRGKALVQPLWGWEDTGEGTRQVLNAYLAKYNTAQLTDIIQHHAVVLQKFDKKQNRWREIDPPEKLVNHIIDMGHGYFSNIAGIITNPTMRPDGSLITTPGYDLRRDFGIGRLLILNCRLLEIPRRRL